jgi:hypothetical protein
MRRKKKIELRDKPWMRERKREREREFWYLEKEKKTKEMITIYENE